MDVLRETYDINKQVNKVNKLVYISQFIPNAFVAVLQVNKFKTR